ncbi:hypothetical protein KZI27_00395 (plasmid) [Curtobacterium sp. TC1]|uniref:DUF6036 family nucleotidyltransferase n=1 Tax=Curtobacterium sp. TC1 TaxID=2862880 RepID=UPI001C9B5345|nr:DUF6036 family nucleotidyltransferase [Curtobacterium sp. TC1]QZQ53738.1 hypothetical protein KZI27_00395 [Curtobacterium sp. TC1]
MSDPHGDELDADRLGGLFQELSDRLANVGEHAQLFVVGGAAMALAYDGSRVTRDVDALFEPTGAVRQVAAEMSGPHGLEPDWLNDAVKGFLPGDVHDTRVVFESENLLVQVPPPEYLLAMKMHAARDDRDLDDAATLFNAAGLTTADQGRELLESTYPNRQLLPRHQYLPDEVAARAAAHREESAEQVGNRVPSAADLVQQYAADVRRTGPRDPAGADDAARMATDLRAGRAARPDEAAQRAASDVEAQERAEQVRRQQAAADAQREQEQQRRGLCH